MSKIQWFVKRLESEKLQPLTTLVTFDLSLKLVLSTVKP